MLAADIKANGLIEPITMFDGMILDGRCRCAGYVKAGVEPRTFQCEGSDPVGFAAGSLALFAALPSNPIDRAGTLVSTQAADSLRLCRCVGLLGQATP